MIQAVQSLILDMDGVLWRGDQALGDLPAVFSTIRALELKFVLATNNSTRTVDMYMQRLADFGVHVEKWQIVNSSEATAQYLLKRFPQAGPVFIVGEIGLHKSLEDKGFYHDPEHPQAVVAGMDRQCNFEQLSQCSMHVRSGLPFIATNPDPTFPTPKGLIPGTGALLAAIVAASGVEPFVVGKPSPEMYRVALERLKTTPEHTLVVGDRLETDIAGAQKLGCQTALVLSGVTLPEAAHAWQPPPDLIIDDLTSLLNVLCPKKP